MHFYMWLGHNYAFGLQLAWCMVVFELTLGDFLYYSPCFSSVIIGSLNTLKFINMLIKGLIMWQYNTKMVKYIFQLCEKYLRVSTTNASITFLWYLSFVISSTHLMWGLHRVLQTLPLSLPPFFYLSFSMKFVPPFHTT